MSRHPLTSKLVRDTRDALKRAGASTRQIDRFVAEVALATPRAAQGICEQWLEKFKGRGQGSGARGQGEGEKGIGGSKSMHRSMGRSMGRSMHPQNPEPETQKPAGCDAQAAAECDQCPPVKFFTCVLGKGVELPCAGA